MRITQRAFKSNNRQTIGTEIPLSDVPRWASLEPEATVKNTDGPLFGWYKAATANNVDVDSPLGASVYAKAVEVIEQADRQYSSWVQEGEQLKQIYPSFDLRAESKNPEFGQLLASGVSVKTAYEVIHKDEMISGAMQFASREAEKRVANAVIAGQRRPTEGAASNRAPSLRKTDVSQLTRADREEIDRRVARGEKIRF